MADGKRIRNSRTIISGIASFVFLIVSAVLIFTDFVAFASTENDVGTFDFGVVFLFIALVSGIIGIIKPQKSEVGRILCWCSIVCPVMFVLFVVFVAIVIKNTEVYSDYYLYDKDRYKIYYDEGEGYFKYEKAEWEDNFLRIRSGADGKFYYAFEFYGPDSNRNHPDLPYCMMLISRENPDFAMIELNSFCEFNNFVLRNDKESRKSEIAYHGGIMILPWKKYQAHNALGEVIDLKYPILYQENTGMIFVEIDFLYKAGFLKLYDKVNCSNFVEYLDFKTKIISKYGEKNDGIIYYNGNKIIGASVDFNNNELLDDGSLIKIGMDRERVIEILGEPELPFRQNMYYPNFSVHIDDNGKVESIGLGLER